ncbi:MAG: hypothetical protein ACXWUG_06290 [Polyangiales bacterium]
MRVLSLAFALTLAACQEPAKETPKEAPKPAPSASSAAAAPAPSVSAPAPAIASAAPSASGSATGHPPTCEVEIFGKVKLPKDLPPKSRVVVYVAQNECLADDASILGHIPTAESGQFVIEVWPKWGTDITICAAVDPGEGKPTTKYGKAKGPFHAEALGEVTFNNLEIELATGKPHTFPKDAPKGEGQH